MSGKERTPFGERLFKARKAAGLTQDQAAEKVGMSQGTLAEAEKKRDGSTYTAALAAVYKVRAQWLADGTGEMREVSAWPFPEIEPERFANLTDAQKLEIQGAVRSLLAEFERTPKGNPSGGGSSHSPEEPLRHAA